MTLALAVCLIVTVHDGDSLRCDGEKVRLVNVDAPELAGSSRCHPKRAVEMADSANPPWCDHALAIRSRDALRAFVGRGRVTIRRVGVDRYRRTLARVYVDGRDAGQWLIGQGLAREWR